MKKIYTVAFTILLFAVAPIASFSQTDEWIKKEFAKYNINEDEWLDGIEVENCKCKSFDANGDNEVSYAEFSKAIKSGKKINVASNNNTKGKPPIENAVVKTNTENSFQYLNNILLFGKNKGWSTKVQEKIFNNYVGNLPQNKQNEIVQLINKANTNSAKFFALKSLLAGDDAATLQRFIAELNNYPEAYQQEHCLVYSNNEIIQQWQFSCSVTTVQTYLADLCPRYAWDVKKIPNYNKVATDPYTNPMAQQQKEFLEKYGGVASARGDVSGKPIGLLYPINELVGNLIGVQFHAQPVTESTVSLLYKIRGILDEGMNVPLHITFIPSDAAHFIMVMKYKYEKGQFHYLIYDPWEGKCNYVSESNLMQGSLAPVLNQWKIKIGYYYPTVSK